MPVKLSKTQLKIRYKKACKDFSNKTENFRTVGNRYGVSRQLVSEWHQQWRDENFPSDKHKDIVEVLIEDKPKVTKEKIGKALTAIELLKKDVPKTLASLMKNIDRAAEKERDPSKISKAFTDIAQFINELSPDGNQVNNTNIFFMEQFQLHQTVKQLGNGQSQRIIPLRDQEE